MFKQYLDRLKNIKQNGFLNKYTKGKNFVSTNYE